MVSTTKKIGILGIGGVGGFVGAPLCEFYESSTDIDIVFICRGKTQENIRRRGLVFESENETRTVRPYLASDDVNEIGILDVLIIATKSYSLKNVLELYRDVIGTHTIIIPLQNMVHAKQIVQETIGEQGTVVEGCIYVSSYIKEPGHIHHVGGPSKVIVGHPQRDRFEWVARTLSECGVNIEFDTNIAEALWRKYLFIAPVGAITTAYDLTIGELLQRPDLLAMLKGMMTEVTELARSHNVHLDDEDVQASMQIMDNFPPETKTSLQLDFENNRQTEKEFLVDYVIEHCAKFGIDSKNYSSVNETILTRIAQPN